MSGPTKEETVETLCKLLGDVHDSTGPGAWDAPCDCFCRHASPLIAADRFRSSGTSLAFVERVVREALARGERP